MSKRKDLKRDETIQLMKEGFSNAEIAELLGITKKRVAANKWEYNVINGTVRPLIKSDVVRRWLKPHNVVPPWKRVPDVRGKKGLVLCERKVDETPDSIDPLDQYNEKILNGLRKMKAASKTAAWEAELDGEVDRAIADMINRPPHYTKGGIEVIDFIESKGLGYNLGNVVKYVSRVDDKDDPLENLRKAEWYLKREIANRESVR